MAWTRRQLLSRTTFLGAAVAVGCSSRVGGSPRPDPAARSASQPDLTPSIIPPLDRVTVGILSYPPYTVENGGEVTGPVPEVARAVLGQLDIPEVELMTLPEEAAVLAALAAGQVDLVGGLAIRADLCGELTFSVPDHVSGTALIVPAGNPKGLTTYAEVVAKGATVAVMNNLPEQQDTAKAGVPAASILPVPSPTELLAAVQDGGADCAAFDDLSARELVKTFGGELVVAKPFPPPNRLPLVGAYAFATGSTELLDSFNNRLRDLHESGDWMQIVAPFGFTEDHAPPPDLTTEKACAGG